LKKRELDRLTKNLTKEKNLVNDLKKKVRDSRNFSNTATKDLEAIIFSLNDNFTTVIDICVENIKDFKDSLCAFG
jgi:Na+/phosphate symporter